MRTGAALPGDARVPCAMENYFNYFTEIEEHFQKRRGQARPLSPLDWSLIESLRDAGVPLEVVLRGVDSRGVPRRLGCRP